jgi:hypothetical protein
LVRQEEHSILDIKNTSTPLEITLVIPDDIQLHTKHGTCIWNNNRYHGCHKDRKEGQIFKYFGKISHL